MVLTESPTESLPIPQQKVLKLFHEHRTHSSFSAAALILIFFLPVHSPQLFFVYALFYMKFIVYIKNTFLE